MHWTYYLISGLTGLVIGSFANVVIVRLPGKQSIVRPGSRCPACESPVRWYDNIPLLSYAVLRGRCRRCRERISVRYPIVEILMAQFFIAALVHSGWTSDLWFRAWPLMFLALTVSFIDLEYRIIPNYLSVGGMVHGLATSFWDPVLGWQQSLTGAVVGFGFMYVFAALYYRLRGRVGLGGGDIKLMGAVGAYVGLHGVILSLMLGSFAGAFAGILLGVSKGRKGIMQQTLPYGPFLILGMLIYYFFGGESWLTTGIPMSP